MEQGSNAPFIFSISHSLCLPLHSNTCSLLYKVTQELLDKVREVEANLQSHTQFEDKMNRLTDWVIVTHQTIITRGLSSSQAQVFLKTGLFLLKTSDFIKHKDGQLSYHHL